jgi:hypothetical protein
VQRCRCPGCTSFRAAGRMSGSATASTTASGPPGGT